MKPRILFVCTANVSRSPYAQYRLTEIFGDEVVSRSAGIPGTEGRPMDPAMEALLPVEDEAALSHRSRILGPDLVQGSDVILTMEFSHHMRILDRWPTAVGRTFGIRQFVDGLQRITPTGGALDRVDRARTAASPNSMMWDIADPYRRGSRAARACALELDGLVLDLGRLLGCKPVSEH